MKDRFIAIAEEEPIIVVVTISNSIYDVWMEWVHMA